MPRYFFEVMYKGTAYSGFQVQRNVQTVQSVFESALLTYLRKPVALSGSSRTDAGVHALQNYFHADLEEELPDKFLYNINAILPADIAVRSARRVGPEFHARFDAVSRSYAYYLYTRKDPFMADRGWFYPFPLEFNQLQIAAEIIREYEDFTSFSKRNTQVKTFTCRIEESFWELTAEGYVYRVKANRFLRGMVRGLVGTMLLVGRGKIGEAEFREIIEAKNCNLADFTTPAHGLFLVQVNYPEQYFGDEDLRTEKI